MPLALLVYVGLALYQLWPAWTDLQHGVVGQWTHPDMISSHWFYRWVAEQVSSGNSIVHNDRYYVPVGDWPWLAGSGSDAVPYTLMALLLPWPGSVTLWVVLVMTLNGLSGYLLARRLGASPVGALVGGAALACCPYVAEEATGGRIAQTVLYWSGFFLVSWHALLEEAPSSGSWRPSRRLLGRAALAGLLFGAAAICYWYAGLWCAMAGGIWFLFRPRWRALVPFIPSALLVAGPVLALFIHGWSEIPGTSEISSFPHAIATEASLPIPFPLLGTPGYWGGLILPLSVLIPAVALLGGLLVRAWQRGAVHGPRAGLSALVRRWRELPWGIRASVAAALYFYAMCLGPFPSWRGGAHGGVPGPFWIYSLSEQLRRFWWPYRHISMFFFALVPLAALGVDAAVAWLETQAEARVRRWVGPVVAVGLALFLPADVGARGGVRSVGVSSWSEPEAYQKLAELPGDVILELPLSPTLVSGQQTLSYQWVHKKKLLNGHAMWVDRVRPAAWDAWVQKNGFLMNLEKMEQGTLSGPMTVTDADMDELRGVGLRYIVVNTEYFPSELAELVVAYHDLFGRLFGEPALAEQDKLYAWDISSLKVQDPVLPMAFRLPPRMRNDREGGRVPSAGMIESQAWAGATRRFPPSLDRSTLPSAPPEPKP